MNQPARGVYYDSTALLLAYLDTETLSPKFILEDIKI